MIKLTWKVSKTVSAPCPDYIPDPYTGEYPTISCCVYHTQEVTEEKSAIFDTQEKADEFIKNAPSSCSEWQFTQLNNYS